MPDDRFYAGKVGRKWGVHDRIHGAQDARNVPSYRIYDSQAQAEKAAASLNNPPPTKKAPAVKKVRSKYHMQTDLGYHPRYPGEGKNKTYTHPFFRKVGDLGGRKGLTTSGEGKQVTDEGARKGLKSG